ncbi:unnamed protein product [Trichobilharzia szidati]|nr:unnamed protein product [Trichobilharzia szidati]
MCNNRLDACELILSTLSIIQNVISKTENESERRNHLLILRESCCQLISTAKRRFYNSLYPKSYMSSGNLFNEYINENLDMAFIEERNII